MQTKRLGQILKKRHLLTGTKLVRALDQQKLHGGKLGQILVDQGSVAEEDLLMALQEHFSVPVIDWEKATLHPSALALIPQSFAADHLLLPVTFIRVPSGSILVVAMENPGDKELIKKLHQQTGYPIKPLLAGRLRLMQAIAEAYRQHPASASAA